MCTVGNSSNLFFEIYFEVAYFSICLLNGSAGYLTIPYCFDIVSLF